MKTLLKTTIKVAIEFAIVFVAAAILFIGWNKVVPELFHYKDITYLQALFVAAAFRALKY